MNRLVTWILLLLYLNASARTVWPVVHDWLAHQFFYHHHLEHVHHGAEHSGHVHHEVAVLLNGASDDDHGHPSVLPLSNPLSAHLPPGEVDFSAPFEFKRGQLEPVAYRNRPAAVCGEVPVQPPERGV